MAFSRIDCSFYSGGSEFATYAGFNPRLKPGSLVLSGAAAVRDSIGSQVASKLALQHFIEGVEDFYTRLQEPVEKPQELSLGVLEAAFKTANSSVYNFGHKLAAGGRMAASLVSVVLDSGVFAAGRVGPGSAYLCRHTEVFPFFETKAKTEPEAADSFLGAHSLVSVELASVTVEPGDRVFIFSCPLDVYQERELASVVIESGNDAPVGVGSIVPQLFADTGELSFAMLASVGPDAIFLNEVIIE